MDDMLRKIAILTPLILILSCLPAGRIALAGGSNDTSMLSEQMRKFVRQYGTKAEEIDPLEASAYLFSLINRERMIRGLNKLTEDELARRVALKQAKQMALERFISHLNLMGQNPIRRYNLEGGTNHIRENVSYWEWKIPVYLTKKVIEGIHQRFMESPRHRTNILNPFHNKVGIGIYIERTDEGTVITCAEEFISDYGRFSALPSRARLNQKLTLKGIPDEGFRLSSILVAYDDSSRIEIPHGLEENPQGFSLPKPFIGILPTDLRYRVRLTSVPTAYLVLYDRSRGSFEVEFSIAELVEKALADPTFSTPTLPPSLRLPPPGRYYIYIMLEDERGNRFIASSQVLHVS